MVQWKRGGEGRLSEVLENRTWGAQKGVFSQELSFWKSFWGVFSLGL